MRNNVLIAAFLICSMIVPSTMAAPRVVPIATDLTATGWKVLTFDGIPATQFKGTADGVLEVRADHSSSVLYHPIDAGAQRPGALSWSWQVIDPLPATDLTKTDGDDRVLALHIGFADDSWMSRLKGVMSPFARGHVLTYVWGGTQEAAFPHLHLPDNGFMIIRRTAAAPSGTWLEETVDLAADYERAFGEAPPPLAFVGISGDADDLASTCFGKIKDIVFN